MSLSQATFEAGRCSHLGSGLQPLLAIHSSAAIQAIGPVMLGLVFVQCLEEEEFRVARIEVFHDAAWHKASTCNRWISQQRPIHPGFIRSEHAEILKP